MQSSFRPLKKKNNKDNFNLIDRYEKGYRDRLAIKGAYLLRDTLMVVGTKDLDVPKATFAIFYDDFKKPKTGGTGHTMKMCNTLGIPLIDQSIWFDWL